MWEEKDRRREREKNIMLVKAITRILPSLRGGDIDLTSQCRSVNNNTLEDKHVE